MRYIFYMSTAALSKASDLAPTPPGMSLTHMWRRAVDHRPHNTFLTWSGPDKSSVSWSYEEFDQVVSRVAARLVDMGVDPESPVHLVLGNSPLFIATWLATTSLGAFVVPSDPTSSPRELREVATRTRPVVTIGATEALEGVDDSGPLGEVVSVDERRPSLAPLDSGETHEWRGAPPPDTPAAVLFTSGTTSRPKGVIVTQANYAFVGRVMAELSGLTPLDTQFIALPLFHANAQYYSLCSAIYVGASVVLAHRFSATHYLTTANRFSVTHASLFAAPIRMILSKSETTDTLANFRNMWFAQNITRTDYEAISRLIGSVPRQLYGMTETISPVLTSDWLTPSHNTIGTVTSGYRIQLVNSSGGTVPIGDVGSLRVRSVYRHGLFAGYYRDAKATQAAFKDDWFVTGDYAWQDEFGVYHFSGRESERLQVSGENVSTVEIENILIEHPAIDDVAVIGEPDNVRDEVPVVYVVWRDAAAVPSIEEIRNFANARLSKSKRPVRYEVMEQLPRTAVGKIKKTELSASLSRAVERGAD